MLAPWNVSLPAYFSVLFAHLPLLSCSLLGLLCIYPEPAQVKLEGNESFKMSFLNVILMAPQSVSQKPKSFYCKWKKIPKIIRHISSRLMKISKRDAWLFPEPRNNGAALYTVFTLGKICRQNVSFELEKASLFPHQTTVQPYFERFCYSLAFVWGFFHLTLPLPSPPVLQTLVMSVALPSLASLALGLFLRFVFIADVFFTPSAVLCTSMEDFRVLSWTMCWSTLLHPAWRFLTPQRVLLLVLEFAASGSAVDVCPGSQTHRSRLFLLLFAVNLLVCYPWALTPTIYVLHSKYFDCPVSIFVWKSLLSGSHCAVY